MGLQNYIEKLRAKPIRERERIAVIGTGIAFAFIFIIWIVSFKEMNKPIEQPVDQSSANLNDLKMNFQEGKDSIQDMMQQLPSQTGEFETDSNDVGGQLPEVSEDQQIPSNNVEEDVNTNQDSPELPQLP